MPFALTASAGAMILGYGTSGMLAIYPPRGINEGEYGAEGLDTIFMFDDLGSYIAWYGVSVAAAAVARLSLRECLNPIRIGMVSLLLTLVPIAMLVLTGLPGLPGVVQQLWLIMISVGLVLTFRTVSFSASRTASMPE